MHANYARIEKAITFITANSSRQPSLDEIAAQVNLSPFHFHRLFVEWVGLSPKEFLSYCTVNKAKQLLRDLNSRIVTVSEQVGLSSPSRLHDLFVKIEGMSPADFRDGNSKVTMYYSFEDSLFGNYFVVSTSKGICYLAFADDFENELTKVSRMFPGVQLINRSPDLHRALQQLFLGNTTDLRQLKLHLSASPFRLKVWEALLRVPPGEICTYAELANAIGKPKAARAVGNAVAANPVAYLIPCHRVILKTGAIGNYMWGASRKNVVLGWEACPVRASSETHAL